MYDQDMNLIGYNKMAANTKKISMKKSRSQAQNHQARCTIHNHSSSIVLLSAAAVLLFGNCLVENVNAFPLMGRLTFSERSLPAKMEGNKANQYIYGSKNTVPGYTNRDIQLFYKSNNGKKRGYSYLVRNWLEARDDDDVVSLYSTKNNNRSKQSTWSKSISKVDVDAGINGGGSKLGVRRRVRSVLKKARNRTGIKNTSFNDDDDGDFPKFKRRDARTVVAEAAAIGGLGATVIDEDSGTIGVSLDFVGDDTSEQTKKASVATITKAKNGVSKSEKDSKAKTVNGYVGVSVNTTEAAIKPKTKKGHPASTPSRSYVMPSNPEDSLVVPKVTKSSSLKDGAKRSSEMDAMRGDLSGAFSLPPEPLPFTLPTLTKEQEMQLREGERVQFQTDMGREGEGFVVLDVNAPADTVWNCLLDFNAYPSTIPTVRDVELYTSTHLSEDYRSEDPIMNGKEIKKLKCGIPSITRAAFILSKFRLKIAAIHKYRTHPRGDYMIFTLDPACTNIVLRNAKGVWHTQSNPDGKGEDWTRVWLLCELKVSSLLPQWITDYAARRAMPRATTWIKPTVEAAASLWLRKQK